MLRWTVLAFECSFFLTWWSISLLGIDGGEPPARAQCQVGQVPPELHPVPMGPAGCGCQGEGEPGLREAPVFLLAVVCFYFLLSSMSALGIQLPLPAGQCPDRVTGGCSQCAPLPAAFPLHPL